MIVSSTYRRGATTRSTPALCLIVRLTDSPPAWKVTCLRAGAPLARTGSSSPQRRSWTTPLRAIECVDTASLGNDAWSDDHHVMPEAGQQHGGGCPGDSRAHDDNVVTAPVRDVHGGVAPVQIDCRCFSSAAGQS